MRTLLLILLVILMPAIARAQRLFILNKTDCEIDCEVYSKDGKCWFDFTIGGGDTILFNSTSSMKWECINGGIPPTQWHYFSLNRTANIELGGWESVWVSDCGLRVGYSMSKTAEGDYVAVLQSTVVTSVSNNVYRRRRR